LSVPTISSTEACYHTSRSFYRMFSVVSQAHPYLFGLLLAVAGAGAVPDIGHHQHGSSHQAYACTRSCGDYTMTHLWHYPRRHEGTHIGRLSIVSSLDAQEGPRAGIKHAQVVNCGGVVL